MDLSTFHVVEYTVWTMSLILPLIIVGCILISISIIVIYYLVHRSRKNSIKFLQSATSIRVRSTRLSSRSYDRYIHNSSYDSSIPGSISVP